MFSPRFAGQPRDRALNPDGTPRATTAGLPVLDDAEARWYFSLEPDAAPEPDHDPQELTTAQRAEWDAYLRTLDRSTGLDSPKTVGARWWCACGAFVAGQTSLCVKCTSWGPHVFSEDNPNAGNAQRRARLRYAHSKRRSIHA